MQEDKEKAVGLGKAAEVSVRSLHIERDRLSWAWWLRSSSTRRRIRGGSASAKVSWRAVRRDFGLI